MKKKSIQSFGSLVFRNGCFFLKSLLLYKNIIALIINRISTFLRFVNNYFLSVPNRRIYVLVTKEFMFSGLFAKNPYPRIKVLNATCIILLF